MDYYDFELGKAVRILIEQLLKVKEGESFVITADTESDPAVVNATAGAAFAVGAKPMVLWTASPLGVGKAADPMLPKNALAAILKEADVWVEFNNKWLLYSTPYDIAMKENKRLRHMCLVGMNADMMVRCIGRVDYPVLEEFVRKIAKMTGKAKHIRMTTPTGEDVEFDNRPDQKVGYSIKADTPGSHFLAGQIGWVPDIESVNGTITFDGSVVPPCGKLEDPIHLTVSGGKVVEVRGGRQAVEFEAWMKSFNHPQMLTLAHVCYGFNPGAKLTGNILEDERVWGCTEWGIGNMPGHEAPSHTDGICLNTSVWLDNVQIIDKGRLVDKELAELARKLGKA